VKYAMALAFVGPDDTGGILKINNADSGPTNASAMAYFTRSNNQSSPTGLNAMLRLSDHSSNVPLYIETSDTAAPLFIVKGSGNVGIGTSAPGSILQIVGGDVTLGALGSSSSLVVSSSSTGNTRVRLDTLSDSGQIRLFNSGNAQMITLVASGNSYLNGGNVGIGTTNPMTKLHIAGSSPGTASNLKITTTSTGDAVTDGVSIGMDGYDSNLGVSFWNFENGGMRFATNNSVKMTILSGGNVGIETTEPNNKLDVYGNIGLGTGTLATNGALRLANNTKVSWRNAADSANLEIRVSHSTGFNFSQGATDIVRLGSDVSYFSLSNVGIGTTSPTATLDISAPKNNNLLKLRSSTGLVGGDWVGISLATGDTGAQPNRSAQIRGYVVGGTDDVELAFLTSDSAAPTEKMRINKLGNVGIGTTNPGAKLSFGTSISTSKGIYLYESSTEKYGLGIGASQLQIYSSSGATKNIAFGQYDGDTFTEAMRIINGNVGIGTTNPLYKLDVIASGTGPIARFNSDNNTGCDIATDGTITCTSDRRLKKNISGSDYGINEIMALRPVEYNWLFESNKARKSIGFIAQEVEDILPQLVMTNADGRKQLNTIGIIPILTKAFQEQHQEVTSIKGQVTSIDGQVIGIKGQVTSIDENIEKLNDITLTAEEKISLISDTLISTKEMLKQVQDDTQTLKSQMEDLKTQNQAIIDFASALETDRLVYKDTLGNINLLDGQLEAEGIVAGAFTIKISENKDPLFGSAIVKAGENKAVITNTNVETESLINITLKSDPNGAVPFVSRQVKGEFDISIKENTASDIIINWWIMQTEK